MEAKDLRIGNKLLFLGDVVTFKNITEIRKDGIFWIKTFEPLIESKNFHFKPIPLNEEWLLKFGFRHVKNNWYNIHANNNTFNVYLFDEIGYRVEIVSQSIAVLKYVHQLQNLYFALTGDELTIKE
jgi:hypothetical protein